MTCEYCERGSQPDAEGNHRDAGGQVVPCADGERGPLRFVNDHEAQLAFVNNDGAGIQFSYFKAKP